VSPKNKVLPLDTLGHCLNLADFSVFLPRHVNLYSTTANLLPLGPKSWNLFVSRYHDKVCDNIRLDSRSQTTLLLLNQHSCHQCNESQNISIGAHSLHLVRLSRRLFDRVNLIKPVSNVCPSVRMCLRTSIHPQKVSLISVKFGV